MVARYWGEARTETARGAASRAPPAEEGDKENAHVNAEAESAQRRILAPADLAPMVVLLASPGGASVTGQLIGVDGGYRL